MRWQAVALVACLAAAIVYSVRKSDETRPEVVIFAAASLTDALSEATHRMSSALPEVDVRLVFGASSTLARQIEAGAEADLFLSANIEWMDYLSTRGLVDDESRVDPLSNRLVVIQPAGQPPIDNIQELASVGNIALADPHSVPAGRYARSALESLELWDQLEDSLIPASDARAALAYVERGAVAAGIVYASDALMTDRVQTSLVVPDAAQPEIRYAFALVADRESTHSQRVLGGLLAEQAAFEEFGLTWIGPPSEHSRPSASAPKRDDWGVIGLSLTVAGWSVLLSLPFAVFFGWLLARKRFFGRSLVENLVQLPLVLPPTVTGFLLLLLLGPSGPVGGLLEQMFGWRIAFSTTAAVLAAAVVAFPLIVQPIRLSLEAVDPGLEEAAATLGAGPWHVFRTVTLPLALPGVLAGAVVGFARSLGELGATLVFAGNIPSETQTIPLAIWSWVNQVGGDQAAVRLVVVSIAISYAALLLASMFNRRATAGSPRRGR